MRLDNFCTEVLFYKSYMVGRSYVGHKMLTTSVFETLQKV